MEYGVRTVPRGWTTTCVDLRDFNGVFSYLLLFLRRIMKIRKIHYADSCCHERIDEEMYRLCDISFAFSEVFLCFDNQERRNRKSLVYD